MLSERRSRIGTRSRPRFSAAAAFESGSEAESEKSLALRAVGFQRGTGSPPPSPLPRLLNRRVGAWAAAWRISSACDRPVAAASCRNASTVPLAHQRARVCSWGPADHGFKIADEVRLVEVAQLLGQQGAIGVG
jgi:hypothetical protein